MMYKERANDDRRSINLVWPSRMRRKVKAREEHNLRNI